MYINLYLFYLSQSIITKNLKYTYLIEDRQCLLLWSKAPFWIEGKEMRELKKKRKEMRVEKIEIHPCCLDYNMKGKETILRNISYEKS